MKEFIWAWFFWFSVVFCTLLTTSLMVAYWLYSTAPSNANTPLFASGFGFILGFIGLGAMTIFVFDKFSQKNVIFKEVENEFFNKVIREMPFFFFALSYFFTMSVYMGMFLLILSYVKNACA